jgi:Hg(II)-responsive transcriptional regulator
MKTRIQPTLKIGQVSKLSGVSIDTIRFYEKENLLTAPHRRESGYREFGSDTVERLRFIRRAKELGFSLQEINDLLGMKERSDNQCKNVRRHADRKVAEIERKIKDLRKMKRAIKKLAEHCGDGLNLKSCPIVQSLEKCGDEACAE